MKSLEIILERSNKNYSEIKKEEMANYKNELYKEYLKSMSPSDVNSDVLLTLKKLKDLGIKIAIGSSSKNTKLILNQTGIIDLFDAISDGTNIVKSKPDPEVFLKAAEFINLDPKDCLVIEDAEAGIIAGNNGGFDTAAIGDAVNYHISTYDIEKISDILKLL